MNNPSPPEIVYRGVILNQDELNFIKDYILSSESYVKSLGPDYYEGTPPDSLGGRHVYFNYLYTPIGDILLPKLKKILAEIQYNIKPLSIQCWANTFKNGERIEFHKHGYNFLSSNIFICGDTKPGTVYVLNGEKILHENVPGEITMFHSELVHGTPDYPGEDIRITMGIDYHNKYMTNKNRFYNVL